jgi:putative membrane protein
LTLLWNSIAARPYVFVFLAAFFVIGTLNRGRTRTLLLLVIGTGVAFLSEWVSVRWGFPYGEYEFFTAAMPGEWVVGGVPVWSSLSFAFIAYAAYETVCFLGLRHRIPATAMLMTLADVVIDPITLLGERWFLGRIYTYSADGFYFGVPLSNFLGWFVVGCLIIWLWEAASRLVRVGCPMRAPGLGPAFYYGIIGFIVVVGFAIGKATIVLAGLALHAPVVFLLWRRVRDAAGTDELLSANVERR